MARRFSYAEKGKGIELARSPPIRKRIQAPPVDTADLIRENSLILIGRLTNPKEQNLWSMIPFISKKWELRGRAMGSDLGNNCFQFKFDLEEDMRKVLTNRPYRYARWMLIIQRWEPIISPTSLSDPLLDQAQRLTPPLLEERTTLHHREKTG
ncbi:unnamed protein product [Microthlaspi erraticum]|uniref:DUF4283 domain-containing protein n=1 Tax=Microthlaspi erraticum TaxID=1685480 RepID=A0A6D2HP70_9BRAS|nr:unnamed protein product [Microthlaspi erraticum]